MSFKAINDYFTNFLTENGDEDFVSLWTDKASQKEFKDFFAKAVPKKQKKKKVEGAPKRNQNSYMFFCKDARPLIKQKNPDMASKDILREMGVQWALLKDNNPKKVKEYEAMAAADKDRYASDKENYTPPESADEEDAPKEKKKKAKKDPDAPKGAINSYLLFCKHERESVKEETELTGNELKAELSSRWKEHKEAKNDVFDKYQAMADEDKARFKRENEQYLANKKNESESEAEAEEVEEKTSKKNAKNKEEDEVVEEEVVEEVVEEKPKQTKAKKVVNEKPKKSKKKIIDDDE